MSWFANRSSEAELASAKLRSRHYVPTLVQRLKPLLYKHILFFLSPTFFIPILIYILTFLLAAVVITTLPQFTFISLDAPIVNPSFQPSRAISISSLCDYKGFKLIMNKGDEKGTLPDTIINTLGWSGGDLVMIDDDDLTIDSFRTYVAQNQASSSTDSKAMLFGVNWSVKKHPVDSDPCGELNQPSPRENSQRSKKDNNYTLSEPQIVTDSSHNEWVQQEATFDRYSYTLFWSTTQNGGGPPHLSLYKYFPDSTIYDVVSPAPPTPLCFYKPNSPTDLDAEGHGADTSTITDSTKPKTFSVNEIGSTMHNYDELPYLQAHFLLQFAIAQLNGFYTDKLLCDFEPDQFRIEIAPFPLQTSTSMEQLSYSPTNPQSLLLAVPLLFSLVIISIIIAVSIAREKVSHIYSSLLSIGIKVFDINLSVFLSYFGVAFAPIFTFLTFFFIFHGHSIVYFLLLILVYIFTMTSAINFTIFLATFFHSGGLIAGVITFIVNVLLLLVSIFAREFLPITNMITALIFYPYTHFMCIRYLILFIHTNSSLPSWYQLAHFKFIASSPFTFFQLIFILIAQSFVFFFASVYFGNCLASGQHHIPLPWTYPLTNLIRCFKRRSPLALKRMIFATSTIEETIPHRNRHAGYPNHSLSNLNQTDFNNNGNYMQFNDNLSESASINSTYSTPSPQQYLARNHAGNGQFAHLPHLHMNDTQQRDTNSSGTDESTQLRHFHRYYILVGDDKDDKLRPSEEWLFEGHPARLEYQNQIHLRQQARVNQQINAYNDISTPSSPQLTKLIQDRHFTPMLSSQGLQQTPAIGRQGTNSSLFTSQGMQPLHSQHSGSKNGSSNNSQPFSPNFNIPMADLCNLPIIQPPTPHERRNTSITIKHVTKRFKNRKGYSGKIIHNTINPLYSMVEMVGGSEPNPFDPMLLMQSSAGNPGVSSIYASGVYESVDLTVAEPAMDLSASQALPKKRKGKKKRAAKPKTTSIDSFFDDDGNDGDDADAPLVSAHADAVLANMSQDASQTTEGSTTTRISSNDSRESTKSYFNNPAKLPLNEDKGKDLNYTYALNDLNLRLYRGQIMSIIGRNSSGTTTLLNILARLQKPTEGTIFLHPPSTEVQSASSTPKGIPTGGRNSGNRGRNGGDSAAENSPATTNVPFNSNTTVLNNDDDYVPFEDEMMNQLNASTATSAPSMSHYTTHQSSSLYHSSNSAQPSSQQTNATNNTNATRNSHINPQTAQIRSFNFDEEFSDDEEENEVSQYKPRYGIAFQDNSYFTHLTVHQNLELFSLFKESISGHHLTDIEREIEIQHLLCVAKLDKFHDNKEHSEIETLSAGQKRKLGIILALLHNPDIVVLDHPTVGADVVSQATIWSMLQVLKYNKTIILSTHSFPEALIADRIAILADGEIKCVGGADFLKEQYNVGFYRLTLSKVQETVHSALEIGPPPLPGTEKKWLDKEAESALEQSQTQNTGLDADTFFSDGPEPVGPNNNDTDQDDEEARDQIADQLESRGSKHDSVNKQQQQQQQQQDEFDLHERLMKSHIVLNPHETGATCPPQIVQLKHMLIRQLDTQLTATYSISPQYDDYLPQILTFLESNKSDLKLTSISLTATTLEDVFKVVHGESLGLADTPTPKAPAPSTESRAADLVTSRANNSPNNSDLLASTARASRSKRVKSNPSGRSGSSSSLATSVSVSRSPSTLNRSSALLQSTADPDSTVRRKKKRKVTTLGASTSGAAVTPGTSRPADARRRSRRSTRPVTPFSREDKRILALPWYQRQFPKESGFDLFMVQLFALFQKRFSLLVSFRHLVLPLIIIIIFVFFTPSFALYLQLAPTSVQVSGSYTDIGREIPFVYIDPEPQRQDLFTPSPPLSPQYPNQFTALNHPSQTDFANSFQNSLDTPRPEQPTQNLATQAFSSVADWFLYHFVHISPHHAPPSSIKLSTQQLEITHSSEDHVQKALFDSRSDRSEPLYFGVSLHRFQFARDAKLYDLYNANWPFQQSPAVIKDEDRYPPLPDTVNSVYSPASSSRSTSHPNTSLTTPPAPNSNNLNFKVAQSTSSKLSKTRQNNLTDLQMRFYHNLTSPHMEAMFIPRFFEIAATLHSKFDCYFPTDINNSDTFSIPAIPLTPIHDSARYTYVELNDDISQTNKVTSTLAKLLPPLTMSLLLLFMLYFQSFELQSKIFHLHRLIGGRLFAFVYLLSYYVFDLALHIVILTCVVFLSQGIKAFEDSVILGNPQQPLSGLNPDKLPTIISRIFLFIYINSVSNVSFTYILNFIFVGNPLFSIIAIAVTTTIPFFFFNSSESVMNHAGINLFGLTSLFYHVRDCNLLITTAEDTCGRDKIVASVSQLISDAPKSGLLWFPGLLLTLILRFSSIFGKTGAQADGNVIRDFLVKQQPSGTALIRPTMLDYIKSFCCRSTPQTHLRPLGSTGQINYYFHAAQTGAGKNHPLFQKSKKDKKESEHLQQQIRHILSSETYRSAVAMKEDILTGKCMTADAGRNQWAITSMGLRKVFDTPQPIPKAILHVVSTVVFFIISLLPILGSWITQRREWTKLNNSMILQTKLQRLMAAQKQRVLHLKKLKKLSAKLQQQKSLRASQAEEDQQTRILGLSSLNPTGSGNGSDGSRNSEDDSQHNLFPQTPKSLNMNDGDDSDSDDDDDELYNNLANYNDLLKKNGTKSSILGQFDDDDDLQSLTRHLEEDTQTRDGFVALHNLYLSIQRNSCTCISGANGSGKSVFLSLLVNEDVPSSSSDPTNIHTAFIENANIHVNPYEVWSNISFVPQFNRINAALSPRQHLSLYCSLYGIPLRFHPQHIDDVLNSIGLQHISNFPCSALTTGQIRLLQTAIGLIGNTSIVILDEFSTSLDQITRFHLYQLLQHITRTRTVLFCSHFSEEIEYLADNIVILNHGMLQAVGTKGLLRSTTSIEAFTSGLGSEDGTGSIPSTMLPAGSLSLSQRRAMVYTIVFTTANVEDKIETINHALHQLTRIAPPSVDLDAQNLLFSTTLSSPTTLPVASEDSQPGLNSKLLHPLRLIKKSPEWKSYIQACEDNGVVLLINGYNSDRFKFTQLVTQNQFVLQVNIDKVTLTSLFVSLQRIKQQSNGRITRFVASQPTIDQLFASIVESHE